MCPNISTKHLAWTGSNTELATWQLGQGFSELAGVNGLVALALGPSLKFLTWLEQTNQCCCGDATALVQQHW